MKPNFPDVSHNIRIMLKCIFKFTCRIRDVALFTSFQVITSDIIIFFSAQNNFLRKKNYVVLQPEN